MTERCQRCGKTRQAHCEYDEPGVDHEPDCQKRHHEFKPPAAPAGETPVQKFMHAVGGKTYLEALACLGSVLTLLDDAHAPSDDTEDNDEAKATQSDADHHDHGHAAGDDERPANDSDLRPEVTLTDEALRELAEDLFEAGVIWQQGQPRTKPMDVTAFREARDRAVAAALQRAQEGR